MAKKEEKTTSKQKPEGITKAKGERVSLESGAEFYDFEKNPLFTGKYLGDFRKDVTDKKTKEVEKDKLIGYIFEDAETETEVIVGASWQITAALEKVVNGAAAKEGDFLWHIEFKGQTEKSDGQKLNKFKIEIE